MRLSSRAHDPSGPDVVQPPDEAARDPIRVLFANNYDMQRARAGWLAGMYPAHHLYGVAGLGSGFDVVDLPYRTDDLLGRVSRRMDHKLGDFGLQIAAARRRRPSALIYGAAAQELRILAVMRAAGLFSTPIVGVFHDAPSNRLTRLGLRGYDHAIALTQHAGRGLVDGGVASERLTVLGWGADLDFAGFTPRLPARGDARVVATGKAGRDLRTLLDALAATGLPATVYGDRKGLAPVPAAVTVKPVSSNSASSAPMRYDDGVMADLRSAAVVAIPLAGANRLLGLTEVVDALACGRPMILTRTPYFDFDIERIGCGWWVQPGDVRGWSERLTDAMSDRDRLERMGAAGRAWAQQNLNVDLFTAGLRRVLLDVLATSSPDATAGDSEGRSSAGG
jgi:glycosyltransferase involved in cell wall biosynthesis